MMLSPFFSLRENQGANKATFFDWLTWLQKRILRTSLSLFFIVYLCVPVSLAIYFTKQTLNIRINSFGQGLRCECLFSILLGFFPSSYTAVSSKRSCIIIICRSRRKVILSSSSSSYHQHPMPRHIQKPMPSASAESTHWNPVRFHPAWNLAVFLYFLPFFSH